MRARLLEADLDHCTEVTLGQACSAFVLDLDGIRPHGQDGVSRRHFECHGICADLNQEGVEFNAGSIREVDGSTTRTVRYNGCSDVTDAGIQCELQGVGLTRTAILIACNEVVGARLVDLKTRLVAERNGLVVEVPFIEGHIGRAA